MALSETGRFLCAFLRHPRTVGAVAPSSKALARAMCADLQVEPDGLVLEFGPGTGPFTAQIRRQLPDPGCYLGIEREPGFVRLLQQRYPNLSFVLGSAADAVELHARWGDRAVSHIISGLPFASLPPPVQDGVIDTVWRLLRPGGVFRTFQYVHAYSLPAAFRFRRRMQTLFGQVNRSRFVMWNLPPAFVLSWQRTEQAPEVAAPRLAALPSAGSALSLPPSSEDRIMSA